MSDAVLIGLFIFLCVGIFASLVLCFILVFSALEEMRRDKIRRQPVKELKK